MRITNKVMQNNALININRNKELQDTLNTELSTGKKINKPSEDPVVAIRALRLRSDVTQVSQYSKKNVPDAQSWLELTESSVKTTLSVVKDMIEQCEKGSNDTLTTSDRQIIIDELKELRNEVYATGDADYAGRYIFTGYRTDMSLTFSGNANEKYSITELFGADDLEQMEYVDYKNLLDLSEANFKDTADEPLIKEQSIDRYSYYRIRLSYDNLAELNGNTIQLFDGYDTNGDPMYTPYTVSEQTDKVQAYRDAQTNEDAVYFVPSAGELVMGKKVYEAIKNSPENVKYTYDKETWKKGDLRPEHYFYCEKDDGTGSGNVIKYNESYLDGRSIDQPINYQVGYNQEIQVNSYAEDIYKHDIGRDVDEIINLANELTNNESMRDKLKKMSNDAEIYSEEEREIIKLDLEAADKSVAFLKDELQKRFSKYITNMQSYLDDTNEAITTIGSRSARLALISNRLDDQTTTFKTLQSENEDVDATEAAVQLSSAQVSYDAALMATSEMIQKTLLNYL